MMQKKETSSTVIHTDCGTLSMEFLGGGRGGEATKFAAFY